MIHPCDKLCGNKTASGYCATTACINPQYSNLGTAQYGQGVQKRIITNADKLRAMTDEELAEMFLTHDEQLYRHCPSDTFAEYCQTKPSVECCDCKTCWLNWLKQEGE